MLLEMICSGKLIYVLLNFRSLKKRNNFKLFTFQLGLRGNSNNKTEALNLFEVVLRTISSRLDF